MFRNIGKILLRHRPSLGCSYRRRLSTRFIENRNYEPKNTLLLTVLGLGSASVGGYYLFSARCVVHADADLSSVERQTPDYFSQLVARHQIGIPFEVPGTQRVDGFTVASNFSNEDSAIAQFHPFSDTLGYFWIGIFDGHNGPYTAGYLKANLGLAVIGQLADLYSMYAVKNRTVDVPNGMVLGVEPGSLPDPVPSDEEIDAAIRKSFISFDDYYVHDTVKQILGLNDTEYAALQADNSEEQPAPSSLPKLETPLDEAVRRLAYAHSGSCALVGLFNAADHSLRVALTGDSRAVLGRRVSVTAPDGTQTVKYAVRPLSEDQNGENKTEAARLSALHPDEPALLKGKRVLGWGPARAFGDGVMKWSRAVQARLHAQVLGDRPRAVCKTPPYFTAEPVITTEKDIQRGDFAVFATDGLWDCLTSEEVVGLVGQWLEDMGATERWTGGDGREYEARVPALPKVVGPGHPPLSSPVPPPANPLTFGLPRHPEVTQRIYSPGDLPVDYPDTYEDDTAMYKYWRREKKFVVEDDNAAAHLVRNALGGQDREFRNALFAMYPPRSRRFMDDITVVVVFFD